MTDRSKEALYNLSYLGKNLPCQIIEKDYNSGELKVFYNEINNKIKITLPSFTVVEFYWDKKSDKVEVHELRLKEGQGSIIDRIVDKKIKELSLPKIPPEKGWIEVKNN